MLMSLFETELSSPDSWRGAGLACDLRGGRPEREHCPALPGEEQSMELGCLRSARPSMSVWDYFRLTSGDFKLMTWFSVCTHLHSLQEPCCPGRRVEPPRRKWESGSAHPPSARFSQPFATVGSSQMLTHANTSNARSSHRHRENGLHA